MAEGARRPDDFLRHALAGYRQSKRARDTTDWEEKERILLSSCHPKQLGFVTDPGRRVAALVARGGGKTTGGRARFVRKMGTTPKARCLYIATTRDQAEELMWGPLKDLCEALDIDAKFNETKLRCEFVKTGATLRLVGADNKREIEKLRGIPFYEVGIDESASYPTQLLDHLLFRVIGPRLGDHNGVLWLIGTPGHILKGPFYDATRPGSEISRPYADRGKPEFADWNRWSFHRWTLEDGAKSVPAMRNLWREALLEKEANNWSDTHPVWLREYKGQWAADDTEHIFKYRPHTEEGEPLNQWDPPRDRRGFAELPSDFADWRFVFGMDMGHSDPFALQVFAWSPSDPGKTLYHVWEFNQRGMYARTIAQMLIGEALDHDRLGGAMESTGWPDAMVADMAGLGGAQLDELKNVYGIGIKAAEKKNKHDAIELFNGDLLDGRIKILKGSVLEEQLMSLQWDEDDYGRLREHKGMRNDCTDAAIYARREAQHLLSAAAGPRSPFFPPRKDPIEEPAESDDRGEYGFLLDDDPDDFWG